MAGIARVVLVGNLTKDPELRHTQGGTAVGSISIAVNSREKVNGEWTDYVSYFDATCFGNTAEACAQYLRKGAQVGIDGRLKQERWADKDSGAKRYAVKVMIDTIQFPPSGSGGGGGGGSERQQPLAAVSDDSNVTFEAPQADFSTPSTDDDIPF